MNNLHISLTDFRNESRVIKETNSIAKIDEIDHVYIAALHSEGLFGTESLNDKVTVNRFILKTRSLNKNLLTQLIKYIEFVFKVLFFYKRKHIKLINIHSLGLLPLGYLLKSIYGAKLIYDTHELESETNGSKGIRKNIAKLVERILIKKVDHVFVVSENIADWYKNTYNIQRPTVVLNAPKLSFPTKTNVFRDTLDIRSDQIIVLYQGGLSKGRGVGFLLSAFKQRHDDKVVILFMGYGELEDDIIKASKQSSRIYFHPAVSPDIVLDFTVSADVGISFIENTCLSYYYCMPNKLFEYAMASLPVIVSNMKEMREMVENYNMGLVVDDSNIESINDTIDCLLTKDLDVMRLNARNAAENHAWEIQEENMLAVYRDQLLH